MTQTELIEQISNSPSYIAAKLACVQQMTLSLPDSRPAVSKYLDIDDGLRRAIGRAFALGLQTNNRQRILDLGSGDGLFVHVCDVLGHDCTGVERPSFGSPYHSFVFDTLPEMLGVVRIRKHIGASLAIGATHSYSIITAYRAWFHIKWNLAELHAFLNSIVSHLAPEGVFLMDFNLLNTDLKYLGDEMRQLLIEVQASGLNDRIHLDRNALLHMLEICRSQNSVLPLFQDGLKDLGVSLGWGRAA